MNKWWCCNNVIGEAIPYWCR